MGARLSEDEVQRALDFCVHLFSPTTPEQHESVRRRLVAAVGVDDAEHQGELEEEAVFVPEQGPRAAVDDNNEGRQIGRAHV